MRATNPPSLQRRIVASPCARRFFGPLFIELNCPFYPIDEMGLGEGDSMGRNKLFESLFFYPPSSLQNLHVWQLAKLHQVIHRR
jgi:hypothetical protein